MTLNVLPYMFVPFAACIIMACAEPVSNPFVGFPPTRQTPQNDGEQAEVTLTRANDGQSSVLVAAYRYTGSHPLPNGFPDIIYGSPPLNGTEVQLFRGASLAGWSYSEDDGESWIAPGKIRPPSGSGSAFIWGDPAVATGFSRPSVVALANLSGSTVLFDRNAMFGVVRYWPTRFSEFVGQCDPTENDCNLVDGVCVAFSEDAGRTFPDVTCRHLSTCPDGTVCTAANCDTETCTAHMSDQTTVAIGRDQGTEEDVSYVAVTDFFGLNATLRVWAIRTGQGPLELKYNWSPITLPVEFTGTRGPELRRDRLGNVWLAAATAGQVGDSQNNSSLTMCIIQGDDCVSVPLVGLEPFATWPVAEFDKVIIRSGQGIDFAVNVPDPPDPFENPIEIRIVTHHLTPGNNLNPDVDVKVHRCIQFLGGFICQVVPEWGTSSLPGQSFQPTISLVDKSAILPGSAPHWSYAFVTDAFTAQPPAEVAQRLSAWQIIMQGTPATASKISRRVPDSSSRVCPAEYPSSLDTVHRWYWGDYIGYTGFLRDGSSDEWVHVAAFSHDNGQGCEETNIFQGHHLHVASSMWVDP